MRGEGVGGFPIFFGTFSRGAFLVDKGVFFFQNANNLNFKLFLGCVHIVCVVFSVLNWLSNLEFRRQIVRKKLYKLHESGGGKENIFFPRRSNQTTYTLSIRSAQSFHLNMVSDSLGVAANQVYDDNDDDDDDGDDDDEVRDDDVDDDDVDDDDVDNDDDDNGDDDDDDDDDDNDD